MNNLSSKQYVIDQGPTDPSQITTGFVTDSFSLGGPGTLEIGYFKVGKLYFGFNNNISVGGPYRGVVCAMAGSNATNAARIATLLGLTVNTIYTVTTDVAAGTNTGYRITYNGTNWIDSGTATGTILYAFLAN